MPGLQMGDRGDQHRYPRREAASKSAALTTTLLAPGRSPAHPRAPKRGASTCLEGDEDADPPAAKKCKKPVSKNPASKGGDPPADEERAPPSVPPPHVEAPSPGGPPDPPPVPQPETPPDERRGPLSLPFDGEESGDDGSTISSDSETRSLPDPFRGVTPGTEPGPEGSLPLFPPRVVGRSVGSEDGGEREDPPPAQDRELSPTPCPKPKASGRPKEVVMEAIRVVNLELNRVVMTAALEHGIPESTFVKAFTKEWDQQCRTESTWNVFQRRLAQESDGKASRGEVAALWEDFKKSNEDWEEQVGLFQEDYELETIENRTYFQQQREMQRVFAGMEAYAQRAHVAQLEILFGIVGSTIFQNDALHRLYCSPGLTDFAIKRLGVGDEEFLGLMMTEACDKISASTTEHVRATILERREPGLAAEGAGTSRPTDIVGSKSKKTKAQETNKDGSSTVTIVKKLTCPPLPGNVVVASGKTVDISVDKPALAAAKTYEERVENIKGVILDIMVKGGMRVPKKHRPWGRLPAMLAEAGWCLVNFPANTLMPGELPPGADRTKAQEGIRVVKRGALKVLAKEMAHAEAPGWVLVKGSRTLMEANRMPVVIQAPPVWTSQDKERVMASKRAGGAGSCSSAPLPLEFGRRLYMNLSYDDLGPRYVVRNDGDAEEDDSGEESEGKGKGKGKGRARGKGKASANGEKEGSPVARVPPDDGMNRGAGQTRLAVRIDPPTPEVPPAIAQQHPAPACGGPSSSLPAAAAPPTTTLSSQAGVGVHPHQVHQPPPVPGMLVPPATWIPSQFSPHLPQASGPGVPPYVAGSSGVPAVTHPGGHPGTQNYGYSFASGQQGGYGWYPGGQAQYGYPGNPDYYFQGPGQPHQLPPAHPPVHQQPWEQPPSVVNDRATTPAQETSGGA
ncbi:hypothetical protein MD484_g7820, partial [Candolleomyces efflorescens]